MIKIERTETRDKNVKVKEFKDMAQALCYIQNKSGHPVIDFKHLLEKNQPFITRACIFKIVK